MSIARPPFILAFAADMQGCAYHRILMPLSALMESSVADAVVQMALWPDEIAKAANPDVIIWQRQVEDGQIEIMERWRKMLPNTLFVYELDDYLGEIPQASFHASFMPTDIEARVARALKFCDRVTTTTQKMAEWLTSIGGKDVRVVPNGLPKNRMIERKARPAGQKLRVGWAGGISHAGDLEILRPAMEAIGNEVQWVFMGMQPENPPANVDIEYHEGVAVQDYLTAICRLDLDLVVAPLEDNKFNHCKSNLRLVEAGIMGACVIAQDLTPYKIDNPPLWANPRTPEQWTAAIRSFIRSKSAERQRSIEALQSWVGRKYLLERIMPERMQAWLPTDEHGKQFRPTLAKQGLSPHTQPILACLGAEDSVERMSFLKGLDACSDGLDAACRRAMETGADVLWMRPGTTLTEDGMSVIIASGQHAGTATVVPLASDGMNAFPIMTTWSPMPPSSIELIDSIVRRQLVHQKLAVPVAFGPVVLLNRHAMSMLGAPDVVGCEGNEEHAIAEWSARASARGWRHMQVVDAFVAGVTPPLQPSKSNVERLQARGLADWFQKAPEQIDPVEREAVEIELLRAQWGGPRPGQAGFDAQYTGWSLLTNVQRKEITAETTAPGWFVFTDETAEVSPEFYETLRNTTVDDSVLVVYADHEIVLNDGNKMPEFKPDFDLELLLAQDYVTQVCAVRDSALPQSGIHQRGRLYELMLNIAEGYGHKAFLHIPHILGSAKIPDTPETVAIEVLTRQMAIRKIYGDTVKIDANRSLMGALRVTRRWEPFGEPPLVSIVVPTLGSGRLIQPCVATILQHTRYPNYEVIVVQNGDKFAEPELATAVLNDRRVHVVHFDGEPGFNWSRLNNWAIEKHAAGEYIVAMNDDICVLSKDWLDVMMGQALRKNVGVVGARLVHPMGVIQHVGVICHGGIAGHMHKGLPNGQAGHMGRAILSHEATAVTGACMLFSRARFDEVDGFREEMSHNYGDTAFCLDLYKAGYINIAEMAAELAHPEGTSRPGLQSLEGVKKLLDEGRILSRMCVDRDPYWSPNLALSIAHGGIAIQGLNGESLTWKDFEPKAGAKRVLLVNDKPGVEGHVLSVLRDGDVPFCADLSGFHLKLTAPNTLNVRQWDIRDPNVISSGLAALGIDRIVLCSLTGLNGAAPPIEALQAFSSFDIPVDVEADVAPSSSPTALGAGYQAAWLQAYESLRGVQTEAAE